MIYLGLNGTGVRMRASEFEVRPGNEPDGSAKTREVKRVAGALTKRRLLGRIRVPREGRQLMKFPTSNQWLLRGVRTDAWAASRHAIRENDASNLGYPQYFERARGGYLWDVDGNQYIDFILGYGPIILGHADPRVNESVFEELRKGSCISPMWSPRQVELTELLTEVIPGAEKAFLMKTGSDATAAAVRLARIHTGRDKVVKWGYNGWHDWTAPRPTGVPASTQADTLYFAFNDLESLEAAFSRHSGQLACVIMMPFELEAPEPGFLEGVKSVAHRNGAVFILDEMRSGFRMALGGAQEYFGIQADISTFSKAMANGFPISAVVGRSDLLEGLGKTHMASTFYANPAEMAAAITTISILKESDALPRIWRLGEALQEGLRNLVKELAAPAEVVGYPIAPFVVFGRGEDLEAQEIKARFYAETISRGVLLHPNHQWFLSAAHTEKDIETTLEVCRAAFQTALLSPR